MSSAMPTTTQRDPMFEASSSRITVVRPTTGWAALNLPEIWQYRDLLLTLAMRDVKLRYRQTALGIVWVILQPLIAAAIFSFVFGKIGHFSTDKISPFMFSYAGMLGWNAFSSTLTKSSMCLIGNSQLVSKIYFPRLVLPFSTVCSTLIDFAVGLSLMVILMPVYHVAPTIWLITLPIWLLLIVTLAMGLGLFAAALTVSYRDIQYVLPVFTQFLLFASPVAYSATSIHAHDLKVFFYLNPISGLMQGFRWSMLGVGEVSLGATLYSVAFAALLLVGGVVAFRNMERSFADVI